MVRIQMMGERKNKVIFPDSKSRTSAIGSHSHTNGGERSERNSETSGGDSYDEEANSALFSLFVLATSSVVIGLPLYFYLKQSKLMREGAIKRSRRRFAA